MVNLALIFIYKCIPREAIRMYFDGKIDIMPLGVALLLYAYMHCSVNEKRIAFNSKQGAANAFNYEGKLIYVFHAFRHLEGGDLWWKLNFPTTAQGASS